MNQIELNQTFLDYSSKLKKKIEKQNKKKQYSLDKFKVFSLM